MQELVEVIRCNEVTSLQVLVSSPTPISLLVAIIMMASVPGSTPAAGPPGGANTGGSMTGQFAGMSKQQLYDLLAEMKVSQHLFVVVLTWRLCFGIGDSTRS